MRKKNKSFIVQGSILAFAGILVRVIGLLYRVPLTKIVGDVGMGFYASAFEIYNLLLLLSSQSLPIAVSKIVSENIASKKYANTKRIFKGAIYYSLIVGVIFGGVAMIFADYISNKFYDLPQLSPLLMILAPTILVVCVLGAFRGFFQGMGDMVPTSISQVIEQIVNAIVSVVCAYELIVIVKGVKAIKNLNHSSESYISTVGTFGASGSTLGTLFGAMGALVVLFVFMHIYKKRNLLPIEAENEEVQPYKTIGKTILFTITPVIMSTAIYNISNILDNPIFQNLNGGTSVQRSALYALYSSGYKVLTTMPIAIASALSAAMVPSVVRTYIKGTKEDINKKIDAALKFSMIIAMPCGMGLTALGAQFCDILFSFRNNTMATMMLMSTFTVVFFSLSTISNAILQGIDKLSIPIKNSAISLIAHLIFIVVMLKVFKLGIYSVVIGDFTFALMVCILNNYSIKKYTGYKQNILDIYVKPFIGSALMAILTKLTYMACYKFTASMIISIIPAVIIAVIVYGLILFMFILSEDEVLALPKGAMILSVLKKAHLVK